MTPQLKALAEKYAEDNTFATVRESYLAGFEARDGMDARLREEHAELKTIATELSKYVHNRYALDRFHSLITKIESK